MSTDILPLNELFVYKFIVTSVIFSFIENFILHNVVKEFYFKAYFH